MEFIILLLVVTTSTLIGVLVGHRWGYEDGMDAAYQAVERHYETRGPR